MEARTSISTADLSLHILALNKKLEELNYSTSAKNRMNSVWRVLMTYVDEKAPTPYNETFRKEFVQNVYGHCMEEKQSAYIVTRAIYMLSDFIEYGIVLRYQINKGQGFSSGYAELFKSFLTSQVKRGLTTSSLKSQKSRLFRLEYFLTNMGVQKFNDVTLPMLNRYIETLAGYSATTVSEHIRLLKQLCDYAFKTGFHIKNYLSAMPHVRNIRQQRLPSTFTPEETNSLLSSVDRNNPLGKRNYAMILLAARLGLRISDIRYLQFDSIDWGKKTLSIIQKKTGHFLELPLPDDIGWSIIDYLKHGRPQADGPYVFIRHNPPFTSLTAGSHLIVQQMRKAGIKSPLNRRKGMHALRHGLASAMLEKGVSLPVISQTLGHADIQSTEVYLRISLSQLRQCALEVEL